MIGLDRLDEIQGRADEATAGPWSSHAFGYSGQDEPSSIVVHRGKFDWQAICDGEFVASMPRWDAQEHADAEFIAHARTDVPALVAAVRKVASLHRPVSVEGFDVCERCSSLAGSDAVVSWPCLTYRALDPALGVTS